MRIYVARHAERLDASDDADISEAGHAMARRAGAWLLEDGARLVHVVVTHRRRTRQTAESMLAGMERPDGGARSVPPIAERRGIPDRDAFPAFLDALAAAHAGDVLIVVHHGTQRRVENHHGGAALAVPVDHRNAVFRLERAEATWRVTGGWRGSRVRPR